MQTGKGGMWWSDCPMHAASGVAARVKSALCVKPCFPFTSAELYDSITSWLHHFFKRWIFFFNSKYCPTRLMQDCNIVLNM